MDVTIECHHFMSLVNLKIQWVMHLYVWAPFGQIFLVKKYVVKLGTQAKRIKHKGFVIC